jgi:hypothetical protein
MDDDDFGGGGHSGPSPFMMFQMMGAAMVPILATAMFAPLVLYIVARWRDNREPVPDPHLGIKFALGFFKWQGYVCALGGTGMLLYSITTKMPSEMREVVYRPAFGLLLPGLLVFGVASWALTRTNNLERPQVGRLLAGFNLMLVGGVAFALLLIAFQTLFAKGDSGDPGRAIWSFTFVFVAAWVTQTVMFLGEVSHPVMPQAPPVQPMQ